MSQMKPCPFGCCSEPQIIDVKQSVFVRCTGCGTTSLFRCDYGPPKRNSAHYASREVARSEAIEFWNHRPTEERLESRIRELETVLGAGIGGPVKAG